MTKSFSSTRLKGLPINLGKILFWPLLVIALLAMALEQGLWIRQEIHPGPFRQEDTPGSRAFVFALGSKQGFKCCLASRSDTNERPVQSDLNLWINDRQMGPAHSQHVDIRAGDTTKFSHWSGHVFFSLPNGIENTSAVRARVSYSLRPIGNNTSFLLILTSAVLGFFAYRPALRGLAERKGETIGIALVRAPYLLLRAMSYLGLVASLIYIFFAVVALLAGWALPTTALIRWSSITQWVAGNEPTLGHLLLTCAGLGAVAAWFAPLIPGGIPTIQRDEIMLARFLSRWGFLIATCAFVFSMSVMWSGVARLGDFHGLSIGGLIAFSDAGGYTAAAHDEAKDGLWSAFSSRRPLAAAFRSGLLFFAGYSIPYMLLLQAILLSAVTCFAASAVAQWRGLWAGLAFFALTYIYTRTFIPTSLTEPLGIFWALFSVPFFIEAFRTGSLAPALLAFGATILALMTRMGSMFTIPALMLWMVWQFGRTAREKFIVAALSLSVLFGGISLNFLLQKAYGRAETFTGSNFSYTVCGLTIGTTWDGCPAKIVKDGEQLPQTEQATNKLLYSLAWQNFKNNPTVLLKRLADGSREFIDQLPDLLWRGYLLSVLEPSWVPRHFLAALSMLGVIYVTIKWRDRREIAFWIVLWASVISSAAVVFLDDGRRVLAASIPLLALFFAMGMTGPGIIRTKNVTPDAKLLRFGGFTLFVATLLFFSVPWLAHRLSPVERITGGALARKDNEAIVFGGHRITGFLVVPDGARLREDIPTLHLSDFAKIVELSGVEATYQGLINPVAPALPFGFIFAPRLEKNASSDHQFIVPPEVMEQGDVRAWRFQIKEWQLKPPAGPGYGANYWYYVTHAEPLR